MKRDTFSNLTEWAKHQLNRYCYPPHYAPYETLYVRFMITFLVCWTYRDCPLDQPHPRGISTFVDLQWTCVGSMFAINELLMWLCCALYTLRVAPVLTSSYMTFCYIASNSVYNSYAIFHGNQIIAQILMIRAFAHIYYASIRLMARLWPEKFLSISDNISEDEEESRLVRLGQEVSAGAYFTSVITKLQQSNWRWLQNSHYFIISSMVTRERAHLWGELPSSGSSLPLKMLEDLLTVHPFFPKIMFGGGFFTELLAPLFLHSRWTLLFGGIMIFQMHYWIQWIMQLTFGVNMLLSTANFIHLPYWLHKLCNQTRVGQWFEPLQRFPSIFGTKTDFSRKNVGKKNYDEEEDSLSEADSKPREPTYKKKTNSSSSSQFWSTFRKCPFKLMFALVIFSLVVKESFPFSHWPMYANPINRVVYMQIQDRDGQPLMPTKEFIVPSLSQVNKHYKSICKEYWGGNWEGRSKKEMKCGNSTLYSVIQYTKKKEEVAKRLPLRLVQTTISMDDQNKVSREQHIVGLLEVMPPVVPRKKSLL